MTHRMKMSAIGLALCATGLLGATSSSWAASGDDQYRQDVARCKSGASGQDMQACMREAGASRLERRRNGLSNPGDPQANAMARCKALPVAQRRDCMIQMSGQGNTTVQGSVAGGGILRETVIQVPAGSAGGNGAPAPGSDGQQGIYGQPGAAGYPQPAAPLAPPPAMPPGATAPGSAPGSTPYGNMPAGGSAPYGSTPQQR